MKLSVVIPVYDEEDAISPLYDQLKAVILPLTGDYEILFVDDGSRDSSLVAINELRLKDQHVKCISFSRNFGHQAALTAGLDHATGDAVITMDADLQHPPAVIRELVSRWQQGFACVYSIRRTSQVGVMKRVSSFLFYRILRWMSGISIPESAADFRLFDKKVIVAFRDLRERTRFLRGLTHWVGFKSSFVEYDAPARMLGHTKFTPARMIALAIDAVTSFSTSPLYLAIVIGFLFMALGFCYVIWVLAAFLRGQVVPGWTSLILVICMTAGLQFILLGVIGLYIAKIYQEVKARPLYIVDSKFGL